MGGDIDGEAGGDNAGFSVSLSLDGSKVAVGAYLNDGGGSNAGQVRVFKLEGNAWVQVGGDINGEAAGDFSGTGVSLSSDGNYVAIGADHNDGSGNDAGHGRVYHFNGNAWIKVGADLDGEAAGDELGYSISLSSDGTIVAIGGRRNNGNGSDAGHARVYKYNGTAWVQIDADIDGEAANDESGDSVSLSSDGSTVAIGAQANGGNGEESGHARIYKNDNVLPVEILGFKASQTPNGNTLTWETAAEIRCASFDIERSKTGLLFERIGTVNAIGSYSSYAYLDHFPDNDLTYYRLKINDYNGDFAYSNIINIQSGNFNSAVIYPTLVQETLTVRDVNSFKIIILDGKVVLYVPEVNQQIWDLGQLKNGIYIINGTDNKGRFFAKKIVKYKN